MNAAPRIAALFADGAVAYQTQEEFSGATLLPEELKYVSGAVTKRVQEFAAGRACARAALAQLGFPGVALPAGADRAPCWPPGTVGSIAHSHGLCAAVAAPRDALRAVGLDVERRDCVRPELWRRICTPEETAHLRTLSEAKALEVATLTFSAKEAFYKCQHSLTGQWLGFGDVSVWLEGDAFIVRPNRTLQLSDHVAGPWRGRHAFEADYVVTGICIV